MLYMIYTISTRKVQQNLLFQKLANYFTLHPGLSVTQKISFLLIFLTPYSIPRADENFF